jgi:hypothetical protein
MMRDRRSLYPVAGVVGREPNPAQRGEPMDDFGMHIDQRDQLVRGSGDAQAQAINKIPASCAEFKETYSCHKGDTLPTAAICGAIETVEFSPCRPFPG